MKFYGNLKNNRDFKTNKVYLKSFPTDFSKKDKKIKVFNGQTFRQGIKDEILLI